MTSKEIIAHVARKHGLTVDDLKCETRTRKFAYARQEAMFRLFTECKHLSYPMIGNMFGGRDHSTAIHGVRSHGERLGLTYEEVLTMRENGSPRFARERLPVEAPRNLSEYREAVRL